MFKHNKYLKSIKGFSSNNFDFKINHDYLKKNNCVVGLKLLDSFRLTQFQLEAMRVVIRKKLKKKGNLVLCVKPFLNLTKKSLAVRMGKGKGNFFSNVCPLPKGKIIFFVKNVNILLAVDALKTGGYKIFKRFKIVLYKQ